MRKIITTEDLLGNETLFTKEQVLEIEERALNEAKKYWGGARVGAGRKPKGSQSLNISIKVSAVELEFLKSARELGANLNLIDLKRYAQ